MVVGCIHFVQLVSPAFVANSSILKLGSVVIVDDLVYGSLGILKFVSVSAVCGYVWGHLLEFYVGFLLLDVLVVESFWGAIVVKS